jgi:hypothetical protein
MEGSETGTEKIDRNCKKTQKTHKQIEKKYSKTPKQKPGWRRQGMRRRDGGTGSRDVK